jgi:ARG/rhodanese/phosphatase superfamily protein
VPQTPKHFVRVEDEEGAAVAGTVRASLGRMRAGEPLRAGTLTLIPLLPETPEDERHTGYLPLETAVREQALHVTEQPHETVPELKAASSAEAPVIMICGEQVVGGLQNRVLNTTILVAAHSILDVPVTCVEAGRWHGHRGGYNVAQAATPSGAPEMADERAFATEEIAYASLRKSHAGYVARSLSSGGGYSSDQGAVWNEVAEKLESTGSRSATHAMRAMYSSPARSSQLTEMSEALKRPEGALDFVALVGGKPAGAEIFTDPALAEAYWPKLARTYALDALDTPSAEATDESAETASAEAKLLADALNAEIEVYVSPGLGADVRLHSAAISGAGLVNDGALVHLSLFAEEQPDSAVESGAAQG